MGGWEWKQVASTAETGCRAGVQRIPAQMSGPSTIGIGGLLFTSKIYHYRTIGYILFCEKNITSTLVLIVLKS